MQLSCILCASLFVHFHLWTCEPLQTREALVAILKDLHEQDHFALILFDDKIVTWKGSLVKAIKQNVAEAIDYVNELMDRGSKRKTDCTDFNAKCFCSLLYSND